MIIRFVYTKNHFMKYLGHLDLLRFFERSFRRLALPLKFSEGFNPHPKMTFGGPLSLGVASEYEVMEVEITEDIHVDKFIESFNKMSPLGLKLIDYRIIEKSKSLMHNLALIIYKVSIPRSSCHSTYNLETRLASSETLLLRKKNKKKRWVDKDLKPYIAEIVFLEDEKDHETYRFSIYSKDNGSAKPKDILHLLLKDETSFIIDDVAITRTALFFEDESGYRPLLEL